MNENKSVTTTDEDVNAFMDSYKAKHQFVFKMLQSYQQQHLTYNEMGKVLSQGLDLKFVNQASYHKRSFIGMQSLVVFNPNYGYWEPAYAVIKTGIESLASGKRKTPDKQVIKVYQYLLNVTTANPKRKFEPYYGTNVLFTNGMVDFTELSKPLVPVNSQVVHDAGFMKSSQIPHTFKLVTAPDTHQDTDGNQYTIEDVVKRLTNHDDYQELFFWYTVGLGLMPDYVNNVNIIYRYQHAGSTSLIKTMMTKYYHELTQMAQGSLSMLNNKTAFQEASVDTRLVWLDNQQNPGVLDREYGLSRYDNLAKDTAKFHILYHYGLQPFKTPHLYVETHYPVQFESHSKVIQRETVVSQLNNDEKAQSLMIQLANKLTDNDVMYVVDKASQAFNSIMAMKKSDVVNNKHIPIKMPKWSFVKTWKKQLSK